MDIYEEIAQLTRLKRLVASAAIGEANAMAKTFQDRVVHVTLKETMHAPHMYWEATRGRPPAYASGALARSIRMRSAYTPVSASSEVFATAIYAALQEFGGDTWPSRARYMHWHNSRGPWWKKRVTVPEHPYMSTTANHLALTGQFTAVAMKSFEKATAPVYL